MTFEDFALAAGVVFAGLGGACRDLHRPGTAAAARRARALRRIRIRATLR
jgi:hypothetical protein